jgi:hypothetical protein
MIADASALRRLLAMRVCGETPDVMMRSSAPLKGEEAAFFTVENAEYSAINQHRSALRLKMAATVRTRITAMKKKRSMII